MSIVTTLTNQGLSRTLLLIAFTAVPSCLPAQTVVVGAPSSSYLFDMGRSSIRPLIGLAGSSFLGDPLLTGLQFASVAPNGTTAVAVWPDRVELVADLGKYPDSSSVIGGALANPNQIFWDRNSSAAVFLSSTERQIQFVHRNGGSFSVSSLGLPDSCTGRVKALAADAANAIAAVLCTPDQDAGGTQNLFLIQPNAGPALVQTPSTPVSAAFALNGSFYLAGSDSSISVIRNPASNSTAEFLFVENDVLNGAAALMVQSTDQLLYSADSSQRRVRVYDLNTFQKVDDLDVGWQPTQFQPFLSNSFLMNTGGSSSEPRLLLRTAPQRLVLFVPAGN